MSPFCKLPAWLRIAVAVMFFVAAVVAGIRGRPSAILAVVSLALLALGGWHLSRLRALMLMLIMIPLLIGFLLAGLDWHHPFLARYSAGLFSVIAVLLFMDAVRIEEWIELLHRQGEKLRLQSVSPILIGTAVGIVSLSAGIQEQRACRKLAGIYRWRAKSRASVFLDSLSLPFYSAVESHEFIDEALHRWSSRRRSQEQAGAAIAGAEAEELSTLTFGNSIFAARLGDLYDFPHFTDVVQNLSTSTHLAEPWEEALAGLAKGSTVLEINGRSGELTRRLLGAGLAVTVVEGIRTFRERLRTIQREHESALIIIAGLPLGTLPAGFDRIFFYKDAFLEAINEMEPSILLKRLFTLSKAGARIFFAYPALQTVAAEGTILTGSVPGIGDIHYQYAGYERAGEMATARLLYTLKQEHECYCVRAPLSFRAPDLSSILLTSEEAGFKHKNSAMPQAVGFLLKDQIFVELYKPC